MTFKILTVVGARPQFIKAAVVSRAFATFNQSSQAATFKEVILHTGQHFDEQMSDVFFKEMDIPTPDYHYAFNRLSHGAMTGRMMEQIESVLSEEKPDAVLVYGDTNSTLAGALAAVKCHIPVVHVEAGLRSHNMKMPEEVNRILTDRISSVLCCPTEAAYNNLALEGYGTFDCSIAITGDVMLDAAMHYVRTEELYSQKAQSTIDGISEFYLATLHRAENTDDIRSLSGIVDALNTLHKSTPVIIPLHPRTKSAIDHYELNLECIVSEPVGYFDMIHFLKRCKAVLTDSGGLQKEAFFFHKPCVTLRNETEWVELINNGFNITAGSDRLRILEAINTFSKTQFNWETKLYGNGDAGLNIVREITKLLA